MDNIQAIIEVMKEKLLEKMGDEVDLIIQYGSFLRGNPHKYSDVDLSFVPVHENTWYSITVLFDDRLADLYPMQWSTLEGMAGFRNPSASVLFENRILYQRTPEAAERFGALAGRLKANLQPEARPKMLHLAQELFQTTAYPYFLLRQAASAGHSLACIQQTQIILRTVLHCLAVANQVCADTRKLPQVLALTKLPERFDETLGILTTATQPAELLAACDTLLAATRALLLAEQRSLPGQPETYAGLFDSGYPEFKRDLQAILLGCEKRDPFEIRGSLVSIYHELSCRIARVRTGIDYGSFNSLAEYEQDFAALGFPALLPALAAGDYEQLYRRCEQFDERLQAFLKEESVGLNNFQDFGALANYLDTR